MVKKWRALSTRQRALVVIPVASAAVLLVLSIFSGQLSPIATIPIRLGALIVLLWAAWVRADDPALNPQRFAGRLRYDDSTGNARLVPMARDIEGEE